MNKDQKTLPRFVKDLMIQMQPGIILRVMGTSILVLISIIWLGTGLQGFLFVYRVQMQEIIFHLIFGKCFCIEKCRVRFLT